MEAWIAALTQRYLIEPRPGDAEALVRGTTASPAANALTFVEIRRALQALSKIYVQQRRRIAPAALDSPGKRAAFSLFYAPLHYLLVRNVAAALLPRRPPQGILDLGCGTGVAGAAWALATNAKAKLTGIDVNSWAVKESRWTYRQLGVQGRSRRGDVVKEALPTADHHIIAAYTINELPETSRQKIIDAMLGAARAGATILIIEPIARLSWWSQWEQKFSEVGGRTDAWRFAPELPDIVARLDDAAGLDHSELTGRSLFIDGGATG